MLVVAWVEVPAQPHWSHSRSAARIVRITVLPERSRQENNVRVRALSSSGMKVWDVLRPAEVYFLSKVILDRIVTWHESAVPVECVFFTDDFISAHVTGIITQVLRNSLRQKFIHHAGDVDLEERPLPF